MTTITLTSDGYSYHTLELKAHPSPNEYRQMLQHFYDQAKHSPHGRTYRLPYCSKTLETHCSTVLSSHGILLYFTLKKDRSGIRATIKAVINPRRLIDPDCDYLGIMPPDETSFEYFQDQFTAIMRKHHLPDFLDDWKLTRLDLCVNLLCSQKKSAHEQCRLLHKVMLKEEMTRVCFLDKSADVNTQKEQKERDKHSIKWCNDSYALTIYDKLFQSETEGLSISKRKSYNGILRVEFQCQRNYLRKIEKKVDLDTTSDLLWYMSINSRKIILEHVNRFLPGGIHYKPKAAQKIIRSSSRQKRTKGQLIWLIKQLRYSYTMDSLQKKVEKKFSLTPRSLDKRIDQLQKLGINPIPLRSDFYLDCLPSVPVILESLDDEFSSIKIDKEGNIEH